MSICDDARKYGHMKNAAMFVGVYEVAKAGNDKGLEDGDKLWGRGKEAVIRGLKTKQ